jgi:acetate kinase
MIEVHTLANGQMVFVLPRGGDVIQEVFTRVDEYVLHSLEECATLWPHENARVAASVKETITSGRSDNIWIVCETAYFRDLPEYAVRYALPSALANGYRRFGTDGLFHQWVALQFPPGERIVSVSLNDFPNAAAIRNRIAVDTTGGYTRLESAAGCTTCGDLDPTILLSLADQGKPAQEIATLLNEESGWQALAGTDCTFEQLLVMNTPESELAWRLHFNNTLKMIGAMLANLDVADRIIVGCSANNEWTKYLAELKVALSFTSIPIQALRVNRGLIVEELSRLDD